MRTICKDLYLLCRNKNVSSHNINKIQTNPHDTSFTNQLSRFQNRGSSHIIVAIQKKRKIQKCKLKSLHFVWMFITICMTAISVVAITLKTQYTTNHIAYNNYATNQNAENPNKNANKYANINMDNISYKTFKNEHVTSYNLNWYSAKYQTFNRYQKYRTVSDFNDELFCPLDLELNDNKNKGFKMFLHDIFKLQFPIDCYSNRRKFWIVSHEEGCTAGLFSMLRCWRVHLEIALLLNRTLLFWGDFEHVAPSKYCLDQSDQCFFLPISNCSVNRILNTNLKTGSVYNFKPKTSYAHYPHIDWDNKYNLSKQIQNEFDERGRIWFVTGYTYMKHFGSKYLTQHYNLDQHDLIGIYFSILMRPQPYIEQITENIVNHSLYENFNPMNTISVPIRWSDKCYNFDKKIKGMKYIPAAMYCYRPEEYLSILNEIRKNKPNLNTFIVTSESKEIIENITYLNEFYNYNWTIITNKKDVMQNSGEITKYSTNDNAISIFISMLSTLRIQFASKYMITTWASSWMMGLWVLAKNLNCQPSKVLNRLHVNDNKECIEIFATYWGRKQNKSIVFPPSIVEAHNSNANQLIHNDITLRWDTTERFCQ